MWDQFLDRFMDHFVEFRYQIVTVERACQLASTQVSSNSDAMDEMAPKLPKYVFRRANGSYRYKRNVPKHLQVLLGKSTLYRQLGNSYQEAMQNLPWVHARIENLFTSENEKSARTRSLELIRGALGDEIADMVLAGQVPEYSAIEDALNELGKELHRRKLPAEIVQQVYSGQLQEDVVTLDGTLAKYALTINLDRSNEAAHLSQSH